MKTSKKNTVSKWNDRMLSKIWKEITRDDAAPTYDGLLEVFTRLKLDAFPSSTRERIGLNYVEFLLEVDGWWAHSRIVTPSWQRIHTVGQAVRLVKEVQGSVKARKCGVAS